MIFSRSIPDATFTGFRLSNTNSSFEDLYAWYLVRDGFEYGIEGHSVQIDGLAPRDVVGMAGGIRRDSGWDCCLTRASNTADTICSEGVQICEPRVGRYGDKSCVSSSQDWLKSRDNASATGFEGPDK